MSGRVFRQVDALDEILGLIHGNLGLRRWFKYRDQFDE